MRRNELWLQWAIELQSLAQAGLTYGKDVYDKERYERIREISAEIIAHMSDIPTETVKNLFCNETGYQTPKLDTRAAIFKDDKILLVRENNGKTKYVIFFKGRDNDAITSAFKEYTAKSMEKAKKPSIMKKLHEMSAKVQNKVLEITKTKQRGQTR